ncbi:hypothetical protein HK096_010677, partial [Nowakowskiella sp. JEL0078]
MIKRHLYLIYWFNQKAIPDDMQLSLIFGQKPEQQVKTSKFPKENKVWHPEFEMLGQKAARNPASAATITLKKIPSLYAREPERARLVRILSDFFLSSTVVVHPPKYGLPFAPGFVNFPPSLAEAAIETWGNTTDLTIEELNLNLEMSLSRAVFVTNISSTPSSPKPARSSKLTDPLITTKSHSSVHSSALSAPQSIRNLSLKQTFPYTIFVNDLPAAFCNDSRVIAIIQAQFPYGEIETNTPRRSGQKYVSLFVKYREKCYYVMDVEPLGSKGVLYIREEWLSCDLRVEKRRGYEDTFPIEARSESSEEICNRAKKASSQLSNKFARFDENSLVGNF